MRALSNIKLFSQNAPSWMFDRVLNTPMYIAKEKAGNNINNDLQ